MKLRELEKGMVIHCKTQEDAMVLVNQYYMPTEFVSVYWYTYRENTCYFFTNQNTWMYCSKNYYLREGHEVIEFEDLIIDESIPTLPTKQVLDDYIVCELMSGEVFDFGGMCNASKLNGPNGNLIVFRYDNGKKFLNLAAVPMSNIKLIRYMNSRETINSVMSENDKEE